MDIEAVCSQRKNNIHPLTQNKLCSLQKVLICLMFIRTRRFRRSISLIIIGDLIAFQFNLRLSDSLK